MKNHPSSELKEANISNSQTGDRFPATRLPEGKNRGPATYLHAKQFRRLIWPGESTRVQHIQSILVMPNW